VLLVGAACGAENEYAPGGLDGGSSWSWPDADTGQCFASNDCPVGWTCNEFSTCEPPPPIPPDAAPPLPPEVEREFSEPSAAQRYVYVTMTDLDAVAKIDGTTLSVVSVPVGDRPESVAAMAGTDDAVVLDRGSSTVTIVRPTADRDEKVTLPTMPFLNVLTVSPASRYAIVWFDLAAAVAEAGSIGAVEGIGSFQAVTVLSLGRGEENAVDLAVGFRPREIEFDAEGARAFVVTDHGVSVVDLAEVTAGDVHVTAPISLGIDDDPSTIEVDVTSDGEYAVVRTPARPEVRIVALLGDLAGATWVIPLPAVPTDLDLSPDGTRAFAVLREAATLAVIDVPSDAFAPDGVELVALGDEVVGSAVIDRDAARAVLFTNAFDVERLTVVDLSAPGYPREVCLLEKGVRSVAFAPDGLSALVFHNKHAGDPGTATSVDEFVDRSYGYSVLDPGTCFTSLIYTPVDAGSFAFAPDSQRAYLALDGGDAESATRTLQVLDLGTFTTSDISLGSPPEAVGVLPAAGTVFVSQRHPLGRVTFVELATSATRTVTGFELNSHIVD
jgi:DNA-binding beta-propeller fold protein YncE